MPTLIAHGLNDEDFKSLKEKKGIAAPREILPNGRGVKFATVDKTLKIEEVPEREGYTTDEAPTFYSGVKNWFTNNGPFPVLMFGFFSLTLVFALGDHALPGKRAGLWRQYLAPDARWRICL